MLALCSGSHSLCDGWHRRKFLTFGALTGLAGACGIASARGNVRPPVKPGAGGASGGGAARRCLFLFLTGGPPQHDTWDPKPGAPADIRGELAPIATSVSGIRFSELFPKLAASATRLRTVRSLTHSDTVHTTAGYALLTGLTHPRPNQVAS